MLCLMLCRPRQAWEASDGAVYLLRQLAEVVPQHAIPFLPTLADIAGLNHFPQARNLQETIWKQLGAIMLALGKRVSPSHQREEDFDIGIEDKHNFPDKLIVTFV